MKLVNVAYTLLYNEEKNGVLIVKNRRGDSFDYTLPGGAVEEGETLTQAAIRETKEETGYRIKVKGIVAIAEGFFRRRQHHAVFHTFFGTITGGEMQLTRPEEILDVFWSPLNEADEWLKPIELKPSHLIENRFMAPYIFRGIQ